MPWRNSTDMAAGEATGTPSVNLDVGRHGATAPMWPPEKLAERLFQIVDQTFGDFPGSAAFDGSQEKAAIAGLGRPQDHSRRAIGNRDRSSGVVVQPEIPARNLGPGSGSILAGSHHQSVGFLLDQDNGQAAAQLLFEFGADELIEIVGHLLDVDFLHVAHRSDVGRWPGPGGGRGLRGRKRGSRGGSRGRSRRGRPPADRLDQRLAGAGGLELAGDLRRHREVRAALAHELLDPRRRRAYLKKRDDLVLAQRSGRNDGAARGGLSAKAAANGLDQLPLRRGASQFRLDLRGDLEIDAPVADELDQLLQRQTADPQRVDEALFGDRFGRLRAGRADKQDQNGNPEEGLMSQKRIQRIEWRMDRIKRTLMELGPMRPGSLTRQYKDPQHRAWAYWQIGFTRPVNSRTECVRRERVKELRRRVATHRRFKRLVDQWINLSIEHSRLAMRIVELKATR